MYEVDFVAKDSTNLCGAKKLRLTDGGQSPVTLFTRIGQYNRTKLENEIISNMMMMLYDIDRSSCSNVIWSSFLFIRLVV